MIDEHYGYGIWIYEFLKFEKKLQNQIIKQFFSSLHIGIDYNIFFKQNQNQHNMRKYVTGWISWHSMPTLTIGTKNRIQYSSRFSNSKCWS